MKRILNECVDCGLPCMGNSCPHRNVPRYHCDKCGKEEVLYEFEGEELCKDCIDDILEDRKIEGSY